MKKVLTIAGSDPSGGAGIQADLKVITCLGALGMSVITSITAQNSGGVEEVFGIPPEFVRNQIDVLLKDIKPDSVKTGMLFSEEIVSVVSWGIKVYELSPVVVDPVIRAKNGAILLSEDALSILKNELIPQSYLVTPNLNEASFLSETEVNDIDSAKKAAKAILALGAKNVVVTGGHFEDKAVDIFYDGKTFLELDSPKIESEYGNPHGTGCTYSSAVATFLARGFEIKEAIKRAKRFMDISISSSLKVGSGYPFTNPFAYLENEIEKYRVQKELNEVAKMLILEDVSALIPEVQSNFGYALPNAKTKDDVCAFPARIVKSKDGVVIPKPAEFGASKHIANIILTVMRFDTNFRSAMNIKFSKKIIRICEKAGLKTFSFERSKEPEEVKEKEGSTLAWGVNEVLKELGTVPDVIYDLGDMGKEPMVRILGKNPKDVLEKVIKIKRFGGL